ncbi:WDR48 [Blepharisma stoltei]|uniref:Uncharacterized protein n=1 Tax=Blepharisma stoltei TaxID=1481888 RepID=A0AAU9IMP9_9CILI|nr:unnamed protein product [Blepharisma stoltei]
MKTRSKNISVLFRDGISQSHIKGVNRLQAFENHLFSAGRDGIVRQYDLNTLEIEHAYDRHIHWVSDIQIDATLGLLFSSSYDSTIAIWSLQSSEFATDPIRIIENHKDYIQTLKYIPSQRILYSGGQDYTLIRWEISNLDQIRSIKVLNTNGNSIWCIDADETGELIGMTFSNNTPKIMDTRGAKNFIDLKGHTDHARKIIISPDGRNCLTAGADKTIKLWDIGTHKVIESFHIHSDSVNALKMDWNTGTIFSGDRHGDVFKTEIISKTSEKVIENEFPVLDVLGINSDIWISDTNGDIKTIQSAETKTIKSLPHINKFEVCDNKKWIITKNSEGTVQTWNILTGESEKTENTFEEAVTAKNSGKATPSWFSVKIHLGSLMLEFSHSDSHMAEEDYNGKLINYGSVFMKRVFHHWLLKEEQKYREANPNAPQRISILNEGTSEIEKYVLILIQIAENIIESIYRCPINRLDTDENLPDIPMWVQRLIFSSKYKH